MKPRISILLAITALVALPKAAWAGPVSLSQEQAVKRAVARHPVIRASHHATQGAKALVSMAKTGWLPRVKLEAGYMLVGPVQRLKMEVEVPIPGVDPVSIDNKLGSLHNASVGVTVAWRAFDFGARDVRTAAAKAMAAASRAEGKARAAQIAYAVRASYLAALFFQEVGRATERSMAVAKVDLRDQQVRRKAGIGNDLDLARADIRIAQLSAQLSRARQERSRALITLRLLLGLAPGTPVTLTDGLKALGSRSVVKRADPTRHPSRLRFTALQRATRLEVKRLGRSYWPTLDLVGTFKYQYPKNYFETDVGGLAFTAGVLLSWNVFDGDLIRRQKRQARAKVSEVKALTRAADEEISRKLADAGAQIRIAASSVTTSQRTLKAAEVYLRAARVSLKAGTGTALELRKAEEATDQARLGEIKSYFDGALARASYLLAQGQEAMQ